MARPIALTDADLAAAMASPDAPDWVQVDGRLEKSVTCPSFAAALDFVMAVGKLAEEANHGASVLVRGGIRTPEVVGGKGHGYPDLLELGGVGRIAGEPEGVELVPVGMAHAEASRERGAVYMPVAALLADADPFPCGDLARREPVVDHRGRCRGSRERAPAE